MTTALGYVLGAFGPQGVETITPETLVLALVEFEYLRAIESAARLYMEKPGPRTRALLLSALELLPAEVGA